MALSPQANVLSYDGRFLFKAVSFFFFFFFAPFGWKMAPSLKTIDNFRSKEEGKSAELAKSRGELNACTSHSG